MDAQEDAFLRERGCLFVQIEREPFLSAQSQWFNMEDHVPAFAQKKRQQRDGDCLHLTVLTAKERKQVSRSEHRHKRDQTPQGQVHQPAQKKYPDQAFEQSYQHHFEAPCP